LSSKIRFPRPLREGDRVGVTSPSSGVEPEMWPRMEASIAALRERGYDVVVGECMSAEGVTSAPKAKRAAELMAMLADPEIAAVVPPWGGETAIDLLDQLDWEALAEAEPTWYVGWSDNTTLMLPITLNLGWATLQSWNLNDTRYDASEGLLHWADVAAASGPFVQRSPGRWRVGWDDLRANPDVRTMTLDRHEPWSVLGGGGTEFSGRLIGGCLEVVTPLAGTPYGDVASFGRRHADEGIVVHLEACESNPYDVARMLHGLRLAGWFEHASGVLIGRTPAADADDMTQHQAVAAALGMLDVPIVLDVEIGHLQPFLTLVSGALAHVVVDGERREITQSLR
jgi:muramoyltetrapeptide carboxypeptidase